MKVLGVVLVALALVIGIVPHFTDCQSQGKAIALTNGKTTPMKCHWTGIGELALAFPLFAVGAVEVAGRRKETHRATSVLGIVLGAFVILLPTKLIGVCAAGMMGSTPLCNSVMSPTLQLAGGVVMAVGVLGLVLARGHDSLP